MAAYVFQIEFHGYLSRGVQKERGREIRPDRGQAFSIRTSNIVYYYVPNLPAASRLEAGSVYPLQHSCEQAFGHCRVRAQVVKVNCMVV